MPSVKVTCYYATSVLLLLLLLLLQLQMVLYPVAVSYNARQDNTVQCHTIQYQPSRRKITQKTSSRNIVRVIKSRRMRWAGHVARMGERRGVYSVLVGRPGRKRLLGRPRRRWEDNIKMDFQELGFGEHGLDRADSG